MTWTTRFKKNKNLFTLILMGFLLLLPEAHSFVLLQATCALGGRPIDQALLFTNDRRTITFYVNVDVEVNGGSLTPELSGGQLDTALQEAINNWSGICDSDMQVIYGGRTALTKVSYDGINVLTWDNRTTAEGNGIARTGTLAWASVTADTDNNIFGSCDMTVNGESTSGYPTSTGKFGIDGSSTKTDLVGVLTHEIGHCLGLDHATSSPSYDSTNAFVKKSVMRPSLSVGSTEFRTLSQDDKDFMNCIYPKGGAAKTGKYCTSYHGSGNPDVALSGTSDKGPAAAHTCSSIAASASAKGSGCITKAIASEKEPISFYQSPLIEILSVVFFYALYRVIQIIRAGSQKKKLFLFFLVFLGSTSLFSKNSQAFLLIEAGGEFRLIKPELINSSAALASGDGTYQKDGTLETFKNMIGASGDVLFASSNGILALGGFIKTFSKGVKQQGLTAGGTESVNKVTTLKGNTVGPMARLYAYRSTQAPFGFSFFVDGGIGISRITYDQVVTPKAGTASNVSASAFGVEEFIYLGTNVSFNSFISFQLKGGYSKYKTNAFSVNSATGASYSSLKPGDRLTVQTSSGTPDLTANLSGPSVIAMLSFFL